MTFDSVFFFYLSTLGYALSFTFYLLHAVLGSAKVSALSSAEREAAAGGQRLGIVAGDAALAVPRGRVNWGRLATGMTWLTVAVATVGVILRVIELARVSSWVLTIFLPATTTYETLTFFAWIIPLTYLLLERFYPIKQVGIFTTGLALVMLTVAASPSIAPSSVAPIMPSLQSYYLVIHVFLMLTGIAFLTTGFGATLLFLYERYSGREIVNLERLDELMYKAIAFGSALYGFGGIVLGGLWAKEAWGRYWGFDPKETAMLVAFLGYMIYLHARVRWGWRTPQVAWLAVGGYLLILYAWIGINYFVKSLHGFV